MNALLRLFNMIHRKVFFFPQFLYIFNERLNIQNFCLSRQKTKMIDIPIPLFSDDIYLQETKEWGLSLISSFIKNITKKSLSDINIKEHLKKLETATPENLENKIKDIIDDCSNNQAGLSEDSNQVRIQFLFLLLKIKHALHPLSLLGQQLARRWDRAARTPQRQPSLFLRKAKLSRTPTKESESSRIFFDSPVRDNKPICRICECQINKEEFESHIQQCLGCHSMKVEWQQTNEEINKFLKSEEISKKLNPKIIKMMKNTLDEALFTSSLSHYLSRKLIDQLKNEKNIPQNIIDLFDKRYQLMVKGTELAKKAAASICSEDSPNFNDGYSMPPISLPRLSDFDIIAPISRGAFGSVFLCKRKQTDDIFALKVILADDYQTKNEVLDTEREVMCRASNPSVVSLYWSFRACGTIFFVMSFARGGDLFSLLESVGSLDEDTAIFYIAELIHAVEYLHSLDVVHCDLKPDNILISDTGHLQLTDFGLSKFGAEQREFNRSLLFRFAQSPSVVEKCDDGSPRKRGIVGTPHYIAPESLLKSDYSPPIDWWAVGAIAYELIVGQPPFVGDSEQEVFSKIVAGKYQWPDDVEVSKEYKAFVNDLLQLDPKKRPNAAALKKYAVFKGINFGKIYQQQAPFVPDLKNSTDLSYFQNARNAGKVNMSDFEELKEAACSREKPDEWCCTNLSALAEKNKEIFNSL